MSQVDARGEYHVIVVSMPAEGFDPAAEALARMFHLEPWAAPMILKGAPIVFAAGLTKAEIKAVTPQLQELSKRGIEFRITMRDPGKLSRVHWPVRPQFTAGGSGQALGAAFDWRHQAFVCPSCGETFRFQPLGRLPLVETVPAAPPREMPKPARGAATPMPPAATPKPPVPPPVAAESDLIPLEELGNLEAELESAAPRVAPEAVPAGSSEAGGISPADVASALQGLDFGEAGGQGAIDLSALEVAGAEMPAEGLISAVAEIKADDGGETEAGGAAPHADDDAERYNVFITQIKDASKRKEAAKIIASFRQCSVSDAEQFASRTVFKAADGVPKAAAEDLLGKLKKLSIAARMTKLK